MKRIFSVLLITVLVFALSAPVFAADPANNGSITINNAAVGQTYSIYRMLDLESYDEQGNAYSYKILPAWADFFTQQAPNNSWYTITNPSGFIRVISEPTSAQQVEAFATAAITYAKANNIAPTTTTTTTTTTTVVFDNLALGYYVIESSLGTLCGLTTTNPDATVNAKNKTPTVDKYVQEDSDHGWETKNDADMFQTVNFYAKITAQNGAYGYVLHDKMSEGLTFDANSVKVYTNLSQTVEVPATNYTLVVPDSTASEAETNNPLSGCTFHVVFRQDYLDTLKSNDSIFVFYSATLNEKAVIGGDGNPNKVVLEFGHHTYTEVRETVTYTYGFDLIKHTDGKLLDGATFSLYSRSTGEEANKISLTKIDDKNYRLATAEEITDGTAVTEFAIPQGGPVRIVGLDGRTEYSIKEIEAPVGYNKINTPIKVIFQSANLYSTYQTGKYESAKHGGIAVDNRTGTILPETGGFGTTMFILVGSILVIGTGVLLVTKTRMAKIAD